MDAGPRVWRDLAMEDVVNSTELIELEERYGAHNYHPLDVVIDRALGAWVYDM